MCGDCLKVLNILLSLMPSGWLLSSSLVAPSFRLKNIGCLTQTEEFNSSDDEKAVFLLNIDPIHRGRLCAVE